MLTSPTQCLLIGQNIAALQLVVLYLDKNAPLYYLKAIEQINIRDNYAYIFNDNVYEISIILNECTNFEIIRKK